jgi:hypothetical protein
LKVCKILKLQGLDLLQGCALAKIAPNLPRLAATTSFHHQGRKKRKRKSDGTQPSLLTSVINQVSTSYLHHHITDRRQTISPTACHGSSSQRSRDSLISQVHFEFKSRQIIKNTAWVVNHSIGGIAI